MKMEVGQALDTVCTSEKCEDWFWAAVELEGCCAGGCPSSLSCEHALLYNL